MAEQNQSQSLKETIARGESLADAALRKVFAFGASLAPENDQFEVPERESKDATTGNEETRRREATKDGASPPTKAPFKAEDHANDGKRHLLLACSGSVATIKLPNMVRELSSRSKILSVRIVLTSSARHFLKGQAEEQPDVDGLRALPGVDGIYYDEDEWSPSWTRGAPILHIELRRWADLLVVAPLSANTLAKMVNGLCDNLLTSVIRAWDTEAMMGFAIKKIVESRPQSPSEGESSKGGTSVKKIKDAKAAATVGTTTTHETQIVRRRKLIMVAPAMNTAMWQHPITALQLKVLQDDWKWVKVLVPTEKALACGDVGIGAMKEWSAIVNDIEEALKLDSVQVRQARTSVVAI